MIGCVRHDEGEDVFAMTDNPLVEAVARAICQSDEQNGGAPWDWYGSDKARSGYFDAATAALRAIEDAGYRIEKVGNPNLKG